MIFFSIIIPLYNKEPYIAKTINSVLNQTYQHYELIVVNDGSTDNSAMVAEKLLKDIPNSRVINQVNMGVSIARNNGVLQAKGDYICFLDADDWWDISFLEEMQLMVKKFPEAGLWGCNYWYVKKGMTRLMNKHVSNGYINFFQEFSTLAPIICVGSVCLKKTLFNNLKGFNSEIKLGEDFDLWVRISLNSRIAYVNKPLCYYNQNVNTLNRGIGRLHEPSKNMLWNMDYLEEEEKNNPYYKQLIDRLRVYGLYPYYLSEKYHEIAKQELLKVDWNKQSFKYKFYYSLPVTLLRTYNNILKILSNIKQKFLSSL